MQLEVPMGAVVEAARLAREAGTAVVLNAAPVPEGIELGGVGVGGIPAELLAMTDVLIVNESEAAAMAGPVQDLNQGLARLAAYGPRVVIATLGERGVRYSVDRGVACEVEAFAVEAVDSTGAGDAFVAAFAVRWAEHQAAQALDAMSILDAVCWGAAAGALATRTAGAMPAMPRRGEVVGMLRRAGGG
jgi:ribokinase